MASEKAVVLCSGGLNSAVTAALARQEHEAALLHVRFAHRAASRELASFEKLAERLQISERLVVDMPHFGAVGGNARVSKKHQLQDALAMRDGPSNCHVPGLIGALLWTGYAWAAAIKATKVYLGVCENLGPPGPRTDAIYPDYSREFVHLCGHAFGVASPEHAVTIETPLIDLDRARIVRLGHRLQTPFELTWSCVAGGNEPCGRCIGCATRSRGFLDAALPDPVVLSTRGPEANEHDAALHPLERGNPQKPQAQLQGTGR